MFLRRHKRKDTVRSGSSGPGSLRFHRSLNFHQLNKNVDMFFQLAVAVRDGGAREGERQGRRGEVEEFEEWEGREVVGRAFEGWTHARNPDCKS